MSNPFWPKRTHVKGEQDFSQAALNAANTEQEKGTFVAALTYPLPQSLLIYKGPLRAFTGQVIQI